MQHSVKLVAFGGTRDILGAREMDFPITVPCTAATFLDEVCRRFPALVPFQRSIRVAVNGVYANDDEAVSPGDEIALIPPVSGG
jgi:molybdopterin synthase sulfur carrier subunit